MYQFKFADIGEGLHEGKVTKIFVTPGAQVKDGDILFEVETDKVTSEISSPVNGTVAEIKISEGQNIHVGDVVFLIDDNLNTPVVETNKIESSTSSNADGGASVVGQVKVSDEILDFGFSKATPKVSKSNNLAHGPIRLHQSRPQHLKISPFLMRYVIEHKIDLNLVKPSRLDNIVLQKDLDLVLKQLSVSKSPTPLTPPPPTNTTASELSSFMATGFVARREKTTSMRQAIAKNLKTS